MRELAKRLRAGESPQNLATYIEQLADVAEEIGVVINNRLQHLQATVDLLAEDVSNLSQATDTEPLP